MTTRSAISQQVESRSVAAIECTIPVEMTIDEWRRLRPSRPPRPRRSTRILTAARRVVPLRPVPCDHLHDTTTRYDHDQKVLTFLLVCPVCRTEKVVESRHYEPRFQPAPALRIADASAGATVDELPVRSSRRRLPDVA
jgi:hypothetical protein